MTTRDDKKVALPKPWQSRTVMSPDLYTAAQLESYAAARVAEATDELQRRVAELEANDRRYRFLRDKPSNHFFVTRHVGGATIARYDGCALDETIDTILADREGGKA